MYDKFTIQSFKYVSSLVFKYDGEFSIIASFYRDDIDFFVEVFTLYKFLKDFFIVYFPEDTIRILVDEIEGVIIKIKKCLIEECLLEFFRSDNAIGHKIMMKKFSTSRNILWFFFVKAEKFF